MALSRVFVTSSALALVIAATLTISCKDKPAENATDAAASVAPAVSTATPLASAMPSASASSAHEDGEGRRGGHGGPAGMLFQAASKLELKEDQKAKILAAEKDAQAGGAEAARAGMKEASKDLHTELVAEIKAGKIDTAKLEPKYAAIDKVVIAGHDKEAAALGTLHDTLDATQRKAVVANVRAKEAAREAKMAAHDAGAPDGGAAHAMTMSKRTLEHLTQGLELDADQQKKVDAIATKEDAAAKPGQPDPAEMKKRVEGLLAAFEKDTFDAKKADGFDAKRMRAPMEQQAKLLAQLVPILKPEQREKLATKIEKGPSPHGGRHGGGGRGRGHGDGDGDED